ncbi:MAG: FAD-dependent monooxygenase [Rhodoplanes sp.]
MASTPTIIIAGAGIGGLTAALALARVGLRVRVLEQAARLEETGAGLQLSANATRILIALGLEEPLRSRVVAPEAVRVRQAANGEDLARLPVGRSLRQYGAPYWVIHRGDLQAALLAAVNDHPDITVELDARVQVFGPHPKGVTVGYLRKSGTADATGTAFVGADGLWSAARACLGEKSPPRPADRTAWRALVPADAVPSEFREPVVNLWVGPQAHLVHYPVRAGGAINIVAITTDAWRGTGWSTRSDRAELLTRFSERNWAWPARKLLATPEQWLKWALYDRPPMDRWGRGAATLLGDAAHPMLPFLAQGAAMAIEDAAVLAHGLAHAPGGAAAALRYYESQRRPRTAKVQAAARTNDRIYHLGGPAAVIRDLAMRTVLGGDFLLSRYDWIYDWRPPVEFGGAMS